ncbi:acyl-CoA dehydrogenase family protein [Pollutimonas harenae]|uniref:Acyl-CoA dehydrogenase family protein n=1 Tax=Pollutimonas harenae TaxID=657015 RepID=A0A853GTH1_9BURK|nr:acyl-CoA dehydrogenase [Pollutimonas harenae]NYT86458.1 acyl-CoA dehydrogenase family protein [Pollutimonas harenae]TEA69794.1 acyl-CoA dehydrogenase [Pollutimonas harenae]
MDFTYNEEQRMLTDSLRRLVVEQWGFEQRRKRARQPELDRDAWQALVDLGIAGLLVPEQYDGFGESPATMAAIQLELGRGLVSEPVIPSTVMATTALLSSGNDTIQAECLPRMVTGEWIATVAYLEGDQCNGLTPSVTQAVAAAGGFTLNGSKKLVWQGVRATHLIVSAVLDGTMALFWIPADTASVSLKDYPTIDGDRCATIALDDVALPETALIAQGQEANAALAAAIDYGIAALCAHAAGAMQRLIEITVDYLKTRQQFGRPLADFQALQHRLADMLVRQELAASMAYVAAAALGEADPSERRRQLSSAKVSIAETGRYVGQNAVQLHGGIGMTDELEVGDYFKRLTYADYLLGNTDYHLTQLEALYHQA